jgi:hypothetical protein
VPLEKPIIAYGAERPHTEIPIVVSTTFRLDFYPCVHSALDSRCHLLCVAGKDNGGRSHWVIEVIRSDSSRIVVGLSRKRNSTGVAPD